VFNKGCNVVYFSAGAGGKGGEDRTKKVDEKKNTDSGIM
jgi:hypothetical protein